LPIEEAKNSDAEEEDTSTFSPKNSNESQNTRVRLTNTLDN
jgi:hypothetical protein